MVSGAASSVARDGLETHTGSSANAMASAIPFGPARGVVVTFRP
jgi:hypothetical protein